MGLNRLVSRLVEFLVQAYFFQYFTGHQVQAMKEREAEVQAPGISPVATGKLFDSAIDGAQAHPILFLLRAIRALDRFSSVNGNNVILLNKAIVTHYISP